MMNLENNKIENQLSRTIKDLDLDGRIEYKGLKSCREELHHKFFEKWGHLTRVTPADVNFILIEKNNSFRLRPDKPLISIVVENMFRIIGDTDNDDPNIKNIRMGEYFYTIYMNPKIYIGSEDFNCSRIELYRA